MSRRFFERNAAPLAERFRVVNVDLRGHGESPAHEGGHTVAQYARDVKHVVFERSGHCPMWEEPERWNQVVGDWISAL